VLRGIHDDSSQIFTHEGFRSLLAARFAMVLADIDGVGDD